MINKNIILPLFILVALAQLYVPASMIMGREAVLNEGVEFKFKTQPIDPSDPFRGKYIVLGFENNSIELTDGSMWEPRETVYVTFKTDQEGYAQIAAVSKEAPDVDQGAYLEATVNYMSGGSNPELIIDYPFDRYYMEESKAYEAEVAYRESQIDTSQVAYALVRVKDGEAVLQDVLIDGVPIREVVKQAREREVYEPKD